jgi:ketosteroid isomerase-like protein
MAGGPAQQPEIEHIHTLGERLQGIAAVKESWQQLFYIRKQLRFRQGQLSHTVDTGLTVHVPHEDITLAGSTQHQAIATNVYRFCRSGWHMILHHASPAATPVHDNRIEEHTGNDQTLH